MQKINEILDYKNNLRKEYIRYRKELNLSLKQSMDNKIFDIIVSLKEYQSADLICPYVSTEIEVETKKLIQCSLDNNKQVAVPRCIKGTCNMDFYLINSFDDLEIGSFSVSEPRIDKCKKINNFEHAIIIIPGLCYDDNGYRLGYGKGYYDRFLLKYSTDNPLKVGICYSENVIKSLMHDEFDISADILVTDKKVKYFGG